MIRDTRLDARRWAATTGCRGVITLMAACCIAATAVSGAQAANPLPSVDERRAEAAGIRKLASRHLDLYTDLPSDAEVDRLPELFDQAVPQWAEYFGVEERRVRDWRARAFLIGERARFDSLGLMPQDGNDQFVHGVSIGAQLWLYEQPTAYYRRHLLLHEGTHAFMATLLGGCGPGWYMEGTAELMATHRLEQKQKGVRNLFSNREKVPDTFLRLNVMPGDRREVPMLGRIKLVEDAVAEDRVLGLPAVMQIDNRRHLENESYAWCWAAAKFLDSHPRYHERFRRLRAHVRDPEFNRIVRRRFANEWNELASEWLAFVAALEHGYDFERMAIDFRRGEPLSRERQVVTIAADRGWQSSGVLLEAGRTYRVTASGRYQIAADDDGRPWPCEPGGVTIEYHAGRPLGMLLGAVEGGAGGFAEPIAIGLEQTITPASAGTLYLRVNDSAARLGDNRGELTVVIEAMGDSE